LKIELGAGDGVTYEDGKDRHIIAIIDGKQLILPVEKTLEEIVRIGERLSKKPKYTPGHPPTDPRLTNEVDVVVHPAMEVPENSNEIQVGDIVLYQPKGIAGGYTPEERCEMMNGKLQIGAQYRVLALPEDDSGSIDIINDQAPSPQRITIGRFEVVLHKKTPKVHVQVKQQFEQILDCPNGCKLTKKSGDIIGPETVVLIREEGQDHYEGQCQTCKQTFTAPYPTPAPEKAA
jgi:hypothetical protein